MPIVHSRDATISAMIDGRHMEWHSVPSLADAADRAARAITEFTRAYRRLRREFKAVPRHIAKPKRRTRTKRLL